MVNGSKGHLLSDDDMSIINGGLKETNDDLVRVKCRDCGAIFMVPRGTDPVICKDCGNDCTDDSKGVKGTDKTVASSDVKIGIAGSTLA